MAFLLLVIHTYPGSGNFNISDISCSISDIYGRLLPELSKILETTIMISINLISPENIGKFAVNIGIIENSQILDNTVIVFLPLT